MHRGPFEATDFGADLCLPYSFLTPLGVYFVVIAVDSDMSCVSYLLTLFLTCFQVSQLHIESDTSFSFIYLMILDSYVT